jgi:nucleoside phosphorylase/tetratricopeptide (TPR) repeat protein
MAPSTAESTTPERVNVLIVTAVKLEYDEVLKVHTGAWEGSQWEERPGPTGFTVAFRTFKAANGAPLRVAVTRTLEVGGVAAASAAAPLVTAYRPSCLAMCGVCAGRRGKVQLGDVIIADRLWSYDTGKLTVEEVDGQRVERIQGDTITYNLDPQWKQRAESFQPPADSSWLSARPLPYGPQMDWVLEQILLGGDPRLHPERNTRCPDWKEVLTKLWKKKWLQESTLSLTLEGRAHIERLRLLHLEGLPAPEPFRAHLAPIGTGNMVVEDPEIFNRLSESMRKVLGLEMEGAAIGAVSHQHDVPYMLVMKGVMDFADSEKSDHFKPFAARASAECLLAFLRENLFPPREDFSDVLKPGTSAPPRHLSPAALLNSRYELVPFYEPGRAEQLKDLQQWCEAPEPVSARLFHGPGGMGKTRLFIEWSKRLREQQGWVTGFLEQPVAPERFKALVGYELPKLVVIDYAESRPGLVELLKEVARCRNKAGLGRLRLVLLARNKGDWWEGLLASDVLIKDLLRDTTPTDMAALAEAGAERDTVFLEAARRFAGLRNRAAPERPGVDLAHPRFERVLYLHMAALATVEGLAFTGESLVEEVLEHEERFWRTCLGSELKAMQQWLPIAKKVWRGVTALTLLGGASSERKATALLGRVNGSVDAVLLQLLRDLYPGVEDAYVGGMEPDLLGEAVVLRTLHKEGKDAAETLRRIFESADEQAVRHGLEVLGRLSVDHSEEAGGWIEEVIEQDVDGQAIAALEAAKAVGERTVHSALGLRLASVLVRKGHIKHAMALYAAGLPERTVSLREVALWVTQTMLEHVPEGDDPEAMTLRAGLLVILGNRQSEVGQRERALESTQEAVGAYRELARRNPEAFLPDLAMSLNNLGKVQSEVGQRERALESTQEAVEIHRRLAQHDSETFLPDLAGSLNNLGNRLREMGQRKSALESMQEAVAIRRELAQRGPEAFLPDLASSLSNLGAMQSEAGQRDEALESTQEAVGISRRLARHNPEAFLADLAKGLNNLGNRQSDVGQHESALASTQEAVKIYRGLAKRTPEAFRPDLARSLNNLGSVQSKMGQREEALRSTQEAVQIRRDLALRDPKAFLPGLAGTLNNLSIRQIELELYGEALESAQEAVDVLWPFFIALPQAHVPLMGMILNNVASQFKTLGQPPSPELKEKLSTFESLPQSIP